MGDIAKEFKLPIRPAPSRVKTRWWSEVKVFEFYLDFSAVLSRMVRKPDYDKTWISKGGYREPDTYQLRELHKFLITIMNQFVVAEKETLVTSISVLPILVEYSAMIEDMKETSLSELAPELQKGFQKYFKRMVCFPTYFRPFFPKKIDLLTVLKNGKNITGCTRRRRANSFLSSLKSGSTRDQKQPTSQNSKDFWTARSLL